MLEIFKVGKHKDNRGVERDYTSEMVDEILETYDFKRHRAPILATHNENQPNRGLIAGLKRIGDRLFGIPYEVQSEFKESVNKGEWPAISPRLYHPDDPSNPVPGKWGLRHVAFVQIPAIKGMAMPEFSEHPDWDVEFCFSEISFSGWLDGAIASVLRNLREWFIEKEGLELADRLLPSYLIEQMLVEPVYEQMRENEPTLLNYSEGGKMTEEEIKKRNEELDAREAAIALRERTIQLTAEFSEWIEPLVADGKVLPADKAQHVAALVTAALTGNAKVEFGEGQSISLVDSYKKSLEGRSKIVEYAEKFRKDNQESDSAIEFSAPDGKAVDADALVLHRKVEAYRKAHNVSYEKALEVVAR